MSWMKALGLIGALSMMSTPALSDESSIADIDIAGQWNFVANTGTDCTFTGTAFLTPTDTATEFGCQLTAIQLCSTETWEVRQSCDVVQDGDSVVVISTIDEFVQGIDNGGYRPDNFKLTIKSADLMTGVLVSWGLHLAEFRRSEGSIS